MHCATAATGKRILLVEDNRGECELLQEAIAQQGFGESTLAMHDAESALALLQAQARSPQPALPQVIILDLHLRDMTGIELVYRLRADARLPLIPIVMLTTSDDPRDIRACYEAGASAYVVKPGTFEELSTLAHDLCRHWLHWNRTPHPIESRC
ncbi:MAG: response regulator [Nitrospirota bacterium]